jgi:hypothetical protein
MAAMRRLTLILIVLAVILVSLAAGWVAADLPNVCRRLGVCAQPALSGNQKLQSTPAEMRL